MFKENFASCISMSPIGRQDGMEFYTHGKTGVTGSLPACLECWICGMMK